MLIQLLRKVMTKPLVKSFLDTEDAFILDTGPSGIFGWVGKKASKSEKMNTMRYAMDFAKKQVDTVFVAARIAGKLDGCVSSRSGPIS